MKPSIIVAALLIAAAAVGDAKPPVPCDAQASQMAGSYEVSPEEFDDSDQLIELEKTPDAAGCPCGPSCTCPQGPNCPASCPCYDKQAVQGKERSIVKKGGLFRGGLLGRVFGRR